MANFGQKVDFSPKTLYNGIGMLTYKRPLGLNRNRIAHKSCIVNRQCGVEDSKFMWFPETPYL